MVTLLTIEPINEAHGMLIVEAFNMFFIDRGGKEDGLGYGWGYGYSNGDGYGDGGCTYSGKCPEEWQAE
jgi:hypothetical protein